MKILVLGGGNSPERDVSLRSAAAVSDGLIAAGFEVENIDTKDGLDFLDSISKTDIIFPILHGAEGEDGVIQARMEALGLAYLGSSSESSHKCMDKDIARGLFVSAGILVAEGVSVDRDSYPLHPLSKKPHVLKVQRGGSSIGTYLVKDPDNVNPKKVAEVFELDNLAILEELIVGIEITIPIMDGEALPVIEIRPPENLEFDYENKYNGATAEICPAESIDEAAQLHAQELSKKAYEVMGCRHLARADMMVRPNGEMVMLEINTMPGMTNQSLFPKSAQVAGMPMPELMAKFVELVKRDYNL